MGFIQSGDDHTPSNNNNFGSVCALTEDDIQPHITEQNDDYNPYEHRHLEHPNTFYGALIHLLKTSLGTGILAVPLAFSQVGYGFGLVGTVLMGTLCAHTMTLLVSASQRMCCKTKVPQLSFAETVESVIENGPNKLRRWSRASRIFVEIGLIVTYLLNDSVYAVFVGHSLKEIIDSYIPEAKDYGMTYYLIAQMILLSFFCQIRPLKLLVPFSTVANCSMIVAYGITFYYMFRNIVHVSLSDRYIIKDNLIGIPHFISTVVFAMEGFGVVMPLENSMVEAGFLGCPGVLNIALSVIVTLYASFGIFGYFAYGDVTKGDIISNLPKEEWLPNFARGCIGLAVFLSFMLQFYVPMEITWRNIKPRIPKKRRNITQILMRIIGVVFAIGVALVVPDFSNLIALVGAIFYSTLGLLVPAVVDTILKWDDDLGAFKWILIKNTLVGIFSVFALVSGSYFSISKLISHEE